ncbi:MAG: hypothetical protein ACI4TF_12035, partial [Oliverpabstia sp.]
MKKSRIKFALIGAGSMSFAPVTIVDILLNESFKTVPLTIALMDINQDALDLSAEYIRNVLEVTKRSIDVQVTTNLEEAVTDADFVVTAIEVDRYYYWSMDFHLPRRYGFRQIYGENGGPGGMFHMLRNLPPMLEIAHTMERVCPDAWLLNYTNPEAKLVEAISKLTKIKVVGLCHGEGMGRDQLSKILNIPQEKLVTEVAGLNHFGWFTSIRHKDTNEDLYPLLFEQDKKMNELAQWDELALSRMMMRTYGLYPYPGANHIGEYIAWSDDMIASTKIQYFYDPVQEDPWNGGRVPEFIYSFSQNPTDCSFFPPEGENKKENNDFRERFNLTPDKLKISGEYAIPIAEAIAFDKPCEIGAVNMPNRDYVPGLPNGMVVEVPALVDGTGIHPKKTMALPAAVTAMINVQGTIHQLLIEAYVEKSKNKLLQALLLDPTISNYQ